MAFQRKTIGIIEKKLNKKKYGCLFPGCNQKAIGSHSQQRGGPLEAISESGKVYWLNDNLYKTTNNNKNEFNATLRKCSISEASVFPGFCDNHDKIFSPIESGSLDPESPEQVVLFYLRAIAYEVSRKKRELLRGELMIEAFAEVNEPSELRSWSYLNDGREEFLSRDGNYYLDKAFYYHNNPSSHNLNVIWKKVPKNLGVSTCTCINSLLDNYIEGIANNPEKPNPVFTLNIVPLGQETHINFVWPKESEKENDWLYDQTNTDTKLQKIVNRLVVCETEDLTINPSIWESFSEQKQNKILNCMLHIMTRGQLSDSEIPNLVEF
jgi:hypothetical protein